MDFRIYIVNIEDVDRFNTSFYEIKECAIDCLYDTDIVRLFYELVKHTNDNTNNDIYYVLCDETNSLILII